MMPRPDIEAIRTLAETHASENHQDWHSGLETYGIIASQQDMPELLAYVAELEQTAQKLNNLLVMFKTCFPEDFATLSQAIDEVHADNVTNQARRTVTEKE